METVSLRFVASSVEGDDARLTRLVATRAGVGLDAGARVLGLAAACARMRGRRALSWAGFVGMTIFLMQINETGGLAGRYARTAI